MIQHTRRQSNILDAVLTGIRPQWPGGRSSECMAARLLGVKFRILPEHGVLFVMR